MSGRIVNEADIVNNPSYLLRIADSNLSPLTRGSLSWAGKLEFVAELVRLSKFELSRIRFFGKKGFCEVEAMLSSLGLELETKINLSGPESEFLARLSEAHRKVYACLKPGTELVQSAGRELISQLQLPAELTARMETTPVLMLAVQQLIGAKEVCKRMGLSERDVSRLLKAKVAGTKTCDPI